MRQAFLAGFAAIVFALGALSANISLAQQPQQAKPLQFEVAAIKPGNPQLGSFSHSSGGGPGGQLQMVNTPLKQWVEMGLSVRDYALVAPSWLDTVRFDLSARLPGDKTVLQKAMADGRNPTPEMMKSLLIERFGLKWHEEIRSVSGYELVTDKKVLLKPTGLMDQLLGHSSSGSGPTMINGTNMSIAELVGMLGSTLGRPVVDATHLSGRYDIKLMWRPADDTTVTEDYRRYWKQNGVDVDNLPSSVDAALREQLGLRLQSAKVPSRVIVIDSINRQPTGN